MDKREKEKMICLEVVNEKSEGKRKGIHMSKTLNCHKDQEQKQSSPSWDLTARPPENKLLEKA